MLYLVTKRHAGGLLDGMTTREVTAAEFTVGQTYTRVCGRGRYTVVAVEPAP